MDGSTENHERDGNTVYEKASPPRANSRAGNRVHSCITELAPSERVHDYSHHTLVSGTTTTHERASGGLPEYKHAGSLDEGMTDAKTTNGKNENNSESETRSQAP